MVTAREGDMFQVNLKINFNINWGVPLFATSSPLLRLLVSLVVVAALSLPLSGAAASGSETCCSGLSPDVDAHPVAAKPPGPIQDNSFLVEEAYNQEFGVVQHISNFTRDFTSHSWIYTFTQEWPVPGLKHQLSCTVGVVNNTNFHRGSGVADSALNYRYQLIGSGETKLAVAPRLSLLAPTGSAAAGRGSGGYGLQINIPASVVINSKLVTHWNIGATVVRRAADDKGDRATATAYNLGQSFVWLAKPRLNFLLETVYAGVESVVAPGCTRLVHDLLVSPGVRWA